MKKNSPHPAWFSFAGLSLPKRFLCAAGALALAAAPVSAQTYNAKMDFSTTVNGGSNPWTYAASITGSNTGNPETVFADISSGWGWAQNGWSGAGQAWENWAIASASENLAQMEPGDFMTHGYTGVVLTIQTTGLYQIDVSSWVGRDNGRTLLGKLMLNDDQDNPLGQGFYTFGSNSRATPYEVFSGQVELTAGDTLRFDTVGWNTGTGTFGAADFAGVNFNVVAVPEPSVTLLLMGAGLVSVVFVRRRRAAAIA